MWKDLLVEALQETSLPVLRLFGREPMDEDLRWVGRWSFAAAWLSEDRATASELVRRRLLGAAKAAVGAAMRAGKGDAQRFALVSALARLPEAIENGVGPYQEAVSQAIEDGATQLLADGAALRTAIYQERVAFAPRFSLETFRGAMLDAGADRHVMMREAASQLDDVLSGRTDCAALRTLRLFLQATLSIDPKDALAALESPPKVREGGIVAKLNALLTADLALAARRASAYENAWGVAARVSGDALSKSLAGLTSGAMLGNNVVEALADDPWALLLALGMTEEPDHASAILDSGIVAQATRRIQAEREVAHWANRAMKLDDLERRFGVEIVANVEDRTGYRAYESTSGLDLFTAWSVVRTAEDARNSLRAAMDHSIAAEKAKRREAIRKAKMALLAAQEAYDSAIEAARGSRVGKEAQIAAEQPDEAGAHRGSAYGLGAGCGVLTTYVVVGAIVGTAGVVQRIAPLVVGVAALPVGAAVLLQIASAIRRAKAQGEAARRRSIVAAEYERARAEAEERHGQSMAQGRERLEAAEASLAELDRYIATGSKRGKEAT